ncbi:Protein DETOXIFICATION 42 [Castilleja foliolosa]|uniref:Protein DETOXIFICATION 42 n=1 Tax=Castilleja foliolosa TaxID=1961234 RepID=A0ABD3BRX3_9LAMI
MGVRGAVVAHVLSQYLISVILFLRLKEQVDLMPPSLEYLQFGRFLKNGFLLLTRVIAVTFCVTLSASMPARLGPTQMAAFQVCLQVWLATSLLADCLAVARQAILASAFSRKDYMWASATVSRVLQLGLVLGLVLAIFLGFGLHYGARIFTRDEDVLRLIGVGIPFVAATQPINALAFVFDGVNFGASDFAYSAYSMPTAHGPITITTSMLLSPLKLNKAGSQWKFAQEIAKLTGAQRLGEQVCRLFRGGNLIEDKVTINNLFTNKVAVCANMFHPVVKNRILSNTNS